MVNIFKKLKEDKSIKKKEEIINKIRTIKYNRLPNRNKKGSLVTDIKEDWFILEDNWISENDKILYDINNDSYDILDYYELTGMKKSGIRHVMCRVACVKLNKKVNIGDILYVY